MNGHAYASTRAEPHRLSLAFVALRPPCAYDAHVVKATTRKPSIPTRGPKRPVNLTLDAELVKRARGMSDNLSAQVESLLTEFVEKREAEDQANRGRSQRAARSWNEFAERSGSFADEFSTL